MVELLRMLASWLSFFFEQEGYRIADSRASQGGFGNAYIVIASDTMRWRLVRDRGQIFLGCGGPTAKSEGYDWFSVSMLFRWRTGRRLDSAELSEDLALWIRSNLEEIEEAFSEENRQETFDSLKRVEKKKAKEGLG